MSKICQITGKTAMVGHKVSHSNVKTKRTFEVNLFKKKFYWVAGDTWLILNVSAAGLRTINKVGLEVAINKALVAGHITPSQLDYAMRRADHIKTNA